nr:signal transducer and activator of transcription C-like [Lytechinus pictus]
MAARGSVLAYSVQPVPKEYFHQQPLQQVQQQQQPLQHQLPHQQQQHPPPPPPEGNRKSLHHRQRRQRQPHHQQQQRHQQARSSCSSSSQEDDQSQQGYGVRNGGYSSNETLRMSEVPVSPTSEDGKELFPQPEVRAKEESLCHPAVRMEPPIAEHIAEERPYYDGRYHELMFEFCNFIILTVLSFHYDTEKMREIRREREEER